MEERERREPAKRYSYLSYLHNILAPFLCNPFSFLPFIRNTVPDPHN